MDSIVTNMLMSNSVFSHHVTKQDSSVSANSTFAPHFNGLGKVVYFSILLSFFFTKMTAEQKGQSTSGIRSGYV